jgi:hypothetical protein
MPNLNFTTAPVTSDTKLVGFDSPVSNGERTYTAQSIADSGSFAGTSTPGKVPGIGGTSSGNAATISQLNTKVTDGGGASAIRVLTQSTYNALTPDSSTIYIIIG